MNNSQTELEMLGAKAQASNLSNPEVKKVLAQLEASLSRKEVQKVNEKMQTT